MKYSFKNDYSEGAHPAILQALLDNNLKQQPGYGDDEYSQEAARLIKDKIGNQNAAVHLVSGGTQANLIVIASILRPFESVIAATTGHINVHEAGAIEATGHRIEAVPTADGKLKPQHILSVLPPAGDVHVTRPRIVYISNSTEIGTFYTRKELYDLAECCRDNSLYLFLDGARLASGICAEGSDLTLQDIAECTDVFYIGGTKNGALLGEAIVITNPAVQTDFAYHLKQRGALLAKGRILGIQFAELFRNNLFFELAKYANQSAARLSAAVVKQGYPLLTISTTNQIFPILPQAVIKQLSEQFEFYQWQKIDEQHAAIRLVTSWATPDEAIDEFILALEAIGS